MNTKTRKSIFKYGILVIAALFVGLPVVAATTLTHKGKEAAVCAAAPLAVTAAATQKKEVTATADINSGTSGGTTIDQRVDDEPITSLLASIDGLRDQCNTMLAGLPPLEQYENAQELSYGLRCLQSYGKNLANMAAEMKTRITAVKAKIMANAEAAAKANAEAALLATGGYVKKTDADAALSQAVTNKETEVRNAFAAEQQKQQRVTARRAELIEAKTLPASVVNAISAEMIAAENYKEAVGMVAERVTKIRAIGLDPEKAAEFTAEMVNLPYTDDGKATFTKRVESVQKLMGATATGTATASATASKGGEAAATPQFPVGGADKKDQGPVRIF
jgi:hypothetical protein